eukprot:GHUV01019924.1.p1 GENE.GHUV01019924.1~~GHUV01019924.1.p1  ORF type:complete len:310 (+),score=63.74 GHUV01019924.1:533-1462(+)
MSEKHQQSLLSWLVAVVTLTSYTGFVNILYALFIGSFFSRTCLYVLLALWATRFLPAKPLLWEAFCGCWIFRTWREYFHYSYLQEAEIDRKQHYIFAEFPHGVIPLSPILATTHRCNVAPGWSVYALAATNVFKVPYLRHLTTWWGGLPATPDNFKLLLKRGGVAVIVGGIAEMYMKDPRKERIKLLNRKGFVRVAVETGTSIIPVYHFGSTQTLGAWPQSAAAAGLSRKYRVAIGFPIGRWLTPVPHQVQFFQVAGAPIPVPRVDPADKEAFSKAVDEVHAKVVDAVKGLYDRHKAEYGWEDRPLVIE